MLIALCLNKQSKFIKNIHYNSKLQLSLSEVYNVYFIYAEKCRIIEGEQKWALWFTPNMLTTFPVFTRGFALVTQNANFVWRQYDTSDVCIWLAWWRRVSKVTHEFRTTFQVLYCYGVSFTLIMGFEEVTRPYKSSNLPG